MNIVSANDNITKDISQNNNVHTQEIVDTKDLVNKSLPVTENAPNITNTKIESKDVTTYYKEKSQLTTYLKDNDNQPIPNKKLSIHINNKNYDKITDNFGKVILKLDLKPGTYTAKIKFTGDDNFTPSSTDAIIKINKAELTLTTKDYKTYFKLT